jgi:hypothetical protein
VYEDQRREERMGKAFSLIVICLVLAFQCLSVVRALPTGQVFEPAIWTPPEVRPPTSLDGEPVGIPDSPFIERYGDKYMYFCMLNGACGSCPDSCNWNPAVDFNHDSVVDIYDAIIFAKNH